MPSQCSKFTYPLSVNENEDISAEIMELLKEKVIVHSTSWYNEFISGIFTRNKKDGNKRMILNLKNFNKFVNYEHFKIEFLNNVFSIIRPIAYRLKFTFDDLFQFTCMRNGYRPAMRVFTKDISKVLVTTLLCMYMIHISKEKHIKLVLIIFQTTLNYWGNWALLFTLNNQC